MPPAAPLPLPPAGAAACIAGAPRSPPLLWILRPGSHLRRGSPHQGAARMAAPSWTVGTGNDDRRTSAVLGRAWATRVRAQRRKGMAHHASTYQSSAASAPARRAPPAPGSHHWHPFRAAARARARCGGKAGRLQGWGAFLLGRAPPRAPSSGWPLSPGGGGGTFLRGVQIPFLARLGHELNRRSWVLRKWRKPARSLRLASRRAPSRRGRKRAIPARGVY